MEEKGTIESWIEIEKKEKLDENFRTTTTTTTNFHHVPFWERKRKIRSITLRYLEVGRFARCYKEKKKICVLNSLFLPYIWGNEVGGGEGRGWGIFTRLRVAWNFWLLFSNQGKKNWFSLVWKGRESCFLEISNSLPTCIFGGTFFIFAIK